VAATTNYSILPLPLPIATVSVQRKWHLWGSILIIYKQKKEDKNGQHDMATSHQKDIVVNYDYD
jgi:hypothetical protein